MAEHVELVYNHYALVPTVPVFQTSISTHPFSFFPLLIIKQIKQTRDGTNKVPPQPGLVPTVVRRTRWRVGAGALSGVFRHVPATEGSRHHGAAVQPAGCHPSSCTLVLDATLLPCTFSAGCHPASLYFSAGCHLLPCTLVLDATLLPCTFSAGCHPASLYF